MVLFDFDLYIFDFSENLDYIWFPKNIRERKINYKENDFLMFDVTMKNEKKKLNIIKIIKKFVYF